MKMIVLDNLDKKTRPGLAPRAPGKASFKDRIRLGHFGDLRLLGVSAVILLLCVVGFLLRSMESDSAIPAATAEQSMASTSPVLFDEEDAQKAFDGGEYSEFEHAATDPKSPIERTPEEQELTLREMAENIPEGEIILW